MIYIADVQRYLNKPLESSDMGFVRPFDDEPDVYEPEVPTGKLVHQPPVENNVSYYRGTFASAENAVLAIQVAFPFASISVE